MHQGSQQSFIVSKAQIRLKLPTKQTIFEKMGLNERVVQSSKKCALLHKIPLSG